MIRDILAHLDGTGSDNTLLTHAEQLVGAFDAHVTGLHTNRIYTVLMRINA